MKKVLIIGTFLLLGIVLNTNFSSEDSNKNASTLTLENIHLLQASANGEIGQRCYGGCKTGSLFDVCVRCDGCLLQFGQLPIGWAGNC